MGLMNAIPGWKYVSAGIGLTVLGIAVYWVISAFVVGPRDLHPAERKALEVAGTQVIDKLRAHLRASDRRFMTLALPDVRNDTSNGELTFMLQDMVKDDRDHFHVASDGMVKSIKVELKEWIVGGAGPPSAEALLRDRSEVDGVLLVTLKHRKPGASSAVVELEGELLERTFNDAHEPTGFQKVTFPAIGEVNFDTLEEVTPGAPGEADDGGSMWWGIWRGILSLLGALIVPFAFLPLNDWITKQGSNVMGVAFLAIVVLASLMPWLALMILSDGGGHISTWIYGVFLAIATFAWAYHMHDAWSERM